MAETRKICFLTVLEAEIQNQSVGVSGFFSHVFCLPSPHTTRALSSLCVSHVLWRSTTNQRWAHTIIQGKKYHNLLSTNKDSNEVSQAL